MAMTSVTGKPSRAVRMAGARTVRQRQLAEARVELGPAIDAARDADRERADLGDAVELLPLEFFEREGVRAAAAGVEAVEPLGFGVPDDGEEVAAEAAAGGFRHGEHGVGRDGGVDGVAARLERFDGGERGERLAGGGHAVLSDGGGAGDE